MIIISNLLLCILSFFRSLSHFYVPSFFIKKKIVPFLQKKNCTIFYIFCFLYPVPSYILPRVVKEII